MDETEGIPGLPSRGGDTLMQDQYWPGEEEFPYELPDQYWPDEPAVRSLNEMFKFLQKVWNDAGKQVGKAYGSHVNSLHMHL